jgi:membrane protein
MFNFIQNSHAVKRALWDVDIASLAWWKAWPTKALRMAYVVVRDLTEGQLTLQAMSLVYTTLLALVPLLAVSFSVLKGFGVHNEIEPFLLNLLSPLGEKGVEISSRVIAFVDNVKAGVLGSVGLALLLYTVVSLIQKIEGAFNYVWRVKRSRPLAQRFSDYLSVILIGPLLVFTAMGITASFTSTDLVQKLIAVEPFGSLLNIAGHLIPYILIIIAFAFIYIFVPNTKVFLNSALVGATASGVLWNIIGWAFASFIVTSTRYTAIYSGFAILIMFMLWVYLNWLILLVGSSIAYYHQHPESLAPDRRRLRLSNELKEKLSLLVMYLVGYNYYHNEPGWTADGLAQRLRVPLEVVEPVIEALERSGLLAATATEPAATYLPARPLDEVEIKKALDAVRSGDGGADYNLVDLVAESAVDRIIKELDQALSKQFEGRTLKELALEEPSTVSLVSQTANDQKVSSNRND